MTTIRYILLAAFTLLFAGCPAQSINGLFDESSRQLIPSLAGSWGEGSGEVLFAFTENRTNQYDAVMTEKGDTSRFIVQTGKIGNEWFLDSYPAARSGDSHSIDVHIFWKVRIHGDTLLLSSLESDRLKELIDAKQLPVSHTRHGDEILLTGPAQELRSLMLRLADDPKAFPEGNPLIRVR